jgi:hypothetical protein
MSKYVRLRGYFSKSKAANKQKSCGNTVLDETCSRVIFFSEYRPVHCVD